MRSWLALLAFAACVPGTARAATKADTLTVVTLNLWHDEHDWPSRLKRIVAEFRAMRPDVICLQEVLQNPVLPNQAQTLADSLGCAWQFASVDGPERPKRYGNAILTPHPVLARGERNLEPANDYRAVAHVRFRWRGREVDAYSTHLHHTPEGGAIRATQLKHLLAYVDSTKLARGDVVLAGDFNAELDAPEMAQVTARYTDAFRAVHSGASRDEASTYNRRFGPDPGVIDHVFVEKARLKPVASDVLFTTTGPDSVWASDHFGLRARLVAPRGR